MPKRCGPNEGQRDATRALLVEAAILVLAERGVAAFAVSEVEKRAGVGRALASYHFRTSEALILAAAEQASVPQGAPLAASVEALLGWVGEQTERAANREPRLLATLQVVLSPSAAGGAILAWRVAYWARATERLGQSLRSAQKLGGIRKDLEPIELASTLLGMLYGEQGRIVALRGKPTPAFLGLLERAIMPTQKKPSRKPVANKPTPPALLDFE